MPICYLPLAKIERESKKEGPDLRAFRVKLFLFYILPIKSCLFKILGFQSNPKPFHFKNLAEFGRGLLWLALPRTPVRLQNLLAQAERLRSDLNQLIVSDELDRLLERLLLIRHQPQRVV